MELPVQQGRRYSLAEYFQLAEASEEKLEYHEGRIVAMAGSSPEHSLITANAIAVLHGLLKSSPCRVYDSNLRIRIAKSARYVYPDASVICGPIEYDAQDTKPRTTTNPRLIVEVLSESTENYDRVEKFQRYFSIPTLQEYVLVSQKRAVVEVFTRQSDGSWSFRFADGIDKSVRLRSLDVDLPLAEVFANVAFPPDELKEGDGRD